MRARLFVNGVDHGEVEVGEKSIVGSFVRGDWQQGLARTLEMAEELRQLLPPRRCLRCGMPVTGSGAQRAPLCATCVKEQHPGGSR